MAKEEKDMPHSVAKEEKDMSHSVAKEEKDMPFWDWKNIQEPVVSTDSSKGVSVKKRPPKRFREIPESYFLPRRSRTYNFFFYGACIAGGIGTGMLIEMWMNKKIKEDGGVIYEFDK